MSGFWRDLRMLRDMSGVALSAVLMLAVIGVFFIYSACYVSSEVPVRSLYQKQLQADRSAELRAVIQTLEEELARSREELDALRAKIRSLKDQVR